MPVRSLRSSVLRWPDRTQVLEAVTHWAEAQGRVHSELLRLGVFGSYARGDWGVGSDVDLVAVVRTATGPFIHRASTWPIEELPVPAELLVYTQEEWTSLMERRDRFAATLRREVLWVYESSSAGARE
jgi:hypothetical protein